MCRTRGQPRPLPLRYRHRLPVSRRNRRAVPSVESESKNTIWAAYFVVLALTLLGIVGTIMAFRNAIDAPAGHGPPGARQGFNAPSAGTWVFLLLFLEVVLTVVLLFPIGRRLFRATAAPAWRTAGTIGLLLVLAPVAFIVVFLSVCAVCVVGMR